MMEIILMKLIFIFISTFIFTLSFKAEASSLKFVHWKCYEHFGIDAKHILTVGYFPKFREEMLEVSPITEIGKQFFDSGSEFAMIDFKTVSKQKFAFYVLRGVQHSFVWGGKSLQDYMIVIDNSGRGDFYNFEGVVEDEKRLSSETFNCKSAYPETVMLDISKHEDWVNDGENILKPK